ncbi:MAG: relaxase/mobilization nuclease domain-containing protein [Proteiniphilum sp.]|nr:relaxase/mobilization nuclease domain-containing protein [Proteiniphilum sp.]MDD3908617.1 relaxase/mobilization nuclease domain-containing protein [Proteiniphilum sp.]MDD4415944.1 relaxase/mobilization nuclease domain-containing protein [Proteiniphilum sp.]
MTTTRLISMHIGKGKTIAASIKDRTDYAENPDKTNNGELITAYECDPATVDAEFLLAKRQYQTITGREQRRNKNVLAYQIRQAFKPGEITPEDANKISYELAMRFTKGKHAFIVATHVDKAHIHSHIIFNSTTLDCTRKFRDFLGSGRAVRKISDRLCLEHGLSIIENPKHGGKHYGKWLGDKKLPSYQDKLRQTIDAALNGKPANFDSFLLAMGAVNYEIKQGKNLSFRASGQKKFTRLRSLGEGYSEQEIRLIIEGKQPLSPSRSKAARREPQKVSLLVDIQAKLLAGKGPGYERWAKVFNLKQMAQTINYLTENSLLEYTELEEKTAQATARFNALSERIKAAETRMSEIGNLKNHIINYSKTSEVYAAYRKAGYSKKFYDAHTSDILLHKAAKAAFDALRMKRLPTVKALQTEYETLLAEKKKVYSEYTIARKEMRELLTAKANVERLLGHAPATPERKNER